jgi:hypothetical protein
MSVVWLFGAATGASAQSRPTSAPVRIEWDASTLRLVERDAGYARMVRLGDRSIGCAYDRQAGLWFRRSNDEAMTWGDPVLVAEERDCWLTNSELLALSTGELLYFWNERPVAALKYQHKAAPPGLLTRPILIRMSRSADHGRTWSPPQTLYTAGPSYQDGCWEPAGIELPSGEVQVYFANEFPFQTTDEQEIAMLRSRDGGLTWNAAKRICMRKDHRDGMPAPLLLAGGRGVAVAIEDNGSSGDAFKPTILRTPLDQDWTAHPVTGEDPRRRAALTEPLPPTWYGGAPCLRQLPDGQTLLSYQESEDGTLAQTRMAVSVGDADALNFADKTYPFPPKVSRGQLWNSLLIKGADTVTAISTATCRGVRGVWVIDGRVRSK